jgi:starch synthase
MNKTRVLFISHEIYPFLDYTEMGRISRFLPQGTQERGKEIRTFMPKFGLINERRNQLHEVIRLSGMNLIINDQDHPLIIKVASIQSARMQVYFIDNEEYFQRKAMFYDERNKFFKDNEDRAVFFCRGVLETVKKLGWNPDIIHVHGWMSSLVPLFVKTGYRDDPMFCNSKVICSIYNDSFEECFSDKFINKLLMDGISLSDVRNLKNANYVSIISNAIHHSDGIIMGSPECHSTVASVIRKSGKPVLEYQSPDNYLDAYNAFYDEILEESPIEA